MSSGSSERNLWVTGGALSTLYCRVSKDGGSTWSLPRSLVFTANIEEVEFGAGNRELWDTSWTGPDMDDGKLQVELYGGVDKVSSQIYKTFGFTLSSTKILTGVRVRVRGAFTEGTILLYYVKVDAHYGTSPLPVKEGSLAYDSDRSRPVFFNGSSWQALAVETE